MWRRLRASVPTESFHLMGSSWSNRPWTRLLPPAHPDAHSLSLVEVLLRVCIVYLSPYPPDGGAEGLEDYSECNHRFSPKVIPVRY